MKIVYDCDTLGFSTMKVGGVCDLYVEIESEKQWGHAFSLLKNRDVFVLGNGSNIVFGDIFHGGILKLTGDFNKIEAVGTCLICGGGASLRGCYNVARENGLSGLEEISGIPATVGGGTFCNCGAFSKEISQLVKWITIKTANGEMKISNAMCGFSYRKSKIPNGVITKVCFQLEEKHKCDIEEKALKIQMQRKSTQPTDLPSCGSVYKRQNGIAVAGLIDSCNLKGYRVGGLEVSKKHAGFIVNIGGGTPSDYVVINEHIKEVVYKKHKITLENEIKFIGELK